MARMLVVFVRQLGMNDSRHGFVHEPRLTYEWAFAQKRGCDGVWGNVTRKHKAIAGTLMVHLPREEERASNVRCKLGMD